MISILTYSLPDSVRDCKNLAGGTWVAPRGRAIALTSPHDGRPIGTLRLSTSADVDDAAIAAHRASIAWGATPMRERAVPLRRFLSLASRHASSLAGTVALESGKTPDEALAGIQRGLEVVEFALSLPNQNSGGALALEVSRGVTCETRREPLGVVAGVTPFNFPAMVPMWMFPIALMLGNAFLLKPSEKVPLSACQMGDWMVDAGFAPGLFSVVHGDRDTVHAIVDHPAVKAIGFVGSTTAARAVYGRATALGKRALCLGGAKNHIIAAPDADEALTVPGVVDSFTGCAGQRCMAASVLVVVAGAERLVDSIVRCAAAIELGSTMGALIDAAAKKRIDDAIARAEDQGARVVLDGRKARPPSVLEGGNWLGPTIIDHVRSDMDCAKVELFGPVLSIVRVATLDDALAWDRSSPYGNATSVFTSSGSVARYVAQHATSAMIGVNVGVPVPRDPFSFGGTKDSKFGQGDMTGWGGVEFWSQLKKITARWATSPDKTWMS